MVQKMRKILGQDVGHCAKAIHLTVGHARPTLEKQSGLLPATETELILQLRVLVYRLIA